MGRYTDKLKLVKVAQNETNWGTPINNNFDKIDNEFNTVDGRIASVRAAIGGMSFIYIDETMDYIEFVDSTHVALGYKNTEGEFVAYKNGDTNYSSLNESSFNTSVEDYQGFYVFEDYPSDKNGNSNSNSLLFGTSWNIGDILVKYSETSGGTRTYKYQKFKQALGGYYVPDLTWRVDPQTKQLYWHITWEPTSGSPPSVPDGNFNIPLPYAQTGLEHFQLSQLNKDDDNNIICPLNDLDYKQTETTLWCPPSVDVTFFEHDVNNTTWQQVEIAYAIVKVGTQTPSWQIKIMPASGVNLDLVSVLIKYYKAEHLSALNLNLIAGSGISLEAESVDTQTNVTISTT